MISADFDLKLGENVVSLSSSVPNARVTALALLPTYQILTDKIVSHAIEQYESSERTISCKAGCGACCAQPVPVSTLEAEHLAKVVQKMPISKQAKVRDKFSESLAAIKAAGLEKSLKELPNLPPEQRIALGKQYFSLKLDCPFLENQSCSIYQDRPLECREYLVTSDPQHCADLNDKEIKHIKLQMSLVPAIVKQSQESQITQSKGWMLMLFCLDWAKKKPIKVRKKHGKLWFQSFMSEATGRDI